jgi:2-C-methyl-D-erythritol 4-phosphate cytidylyltransferase
MKKFALIVAGGNGTRMNSEVPKQFLEIAGLPVMMHTILTFVSFSHQIELIVVLPESLFDHWKTLCTKYNFDVKHSLVQGGETRFHSVKNGLASINEEGIVFIHDAVRPLVSQSTIGHCYTTALQKGNALPVIPVIDSIREVKNDANKAVERSRFFLVQTPQTFQLNLIKKAFQSATHELFTDDASVLEQSGETINLVEGNRENIKITTQSDLIIAEAFLLRNQAK